MMTTETENLEPPQKEEIVEKRVTTTVIRRRARKKVEEAPVEEKAESVEATATAESTEASEAVKAAEVVPEPPAEETEKQPKVAEPVAKTDLAPKEEEKKEDKWKPKKTRTKRTRDDLLMDEYQRAGGLKQAAVLSTRETTESDEGAGTVEPMERVFQPERQQRRGRRVSGRKDFKKTQLTTPSVKKRKIRINQDIAVSDFSSAMSIKATELLQKLAGMGTMMKITDRIDLETAEIIAGEYGFEIDNISFQEEAFIPGKKEAAETEEQKELRAPVVTVMGHVDHGKTSLLDYMRESKVADGEAGGITQHIGAYQIQQNSGVITFIDTPGHEAFTAMRARGAQVTDIVILVVAADDGVKPQTIEAINHAKAAEVPIIVAINKIDKPGVNTDDVKRQLSEQGLLAEDWGGDIIMVPVSAHTGEGIDSLLEMILLQAEVLELKANPNKPAEGIVIEARLEKGRGPLVTVIIKEGTLKKSDPIVAGAQGGRVRAMYGSAGQELTAAGPSTPVEITGLSGVPLAGDELHGLSSNDDAKRVLDYRQETRRAAQLTSQPSVSIDELFAKIQEGEKAELKVVIKADVQGSVEALKASLEQLSTDQVSLNVIHSSVGAITESDVMLAEASQAMIVGFSVRPDAKGRKIAEQAGVTIKIYRVIYDAIDDIKKAMVGLLEPTYEEEYLGRAEVRDVFQVSKVGAIAGSSVVDGKIARGCHVRVLRDGTIIYEGKLASLKRFKEDAKEVAQGYECGIGVENFNDIKVGDVLEAFQMKEIAGTL